MALGLDATQAPAWAQRFATVLQRTFDDLVSVKTRTVLTDADLPDPARWENRQSSSDRSAERRLW
ncbi:hypothetical protein [Caulobacter segnis]